MKRFTTETYCSHKTFVKQFNSMWQIKFISNLSLCHSHKRQQLYILLLSHNEHKWVVASLIIMLDNIKQKGQFKGHRKWLLMPVDRMSRTLLYRQLNCIYALCLTVTILFHFLFLTKHVKLKSFYNFCLCTKSTRKQLNKTT